MDRSTARTVFSVALAVMIVANPLAIPLLGAMNPTGSADALVVPPTCFLSPTESCDPGNDEEIDDLQDHISMYSEALGVYSQSRAFQDVMSNYANDTQDTAWLLAEKEVALAYQNSSTEAEAKVAAKEEVRRYYSLKEWNHINAWNNHVVAMDQMVTEAEQMDGSTYGADGKWTAPGWNVSFDGTSGYRKSKYTTGIVTNITTATAQTDLINGTTVDIRSVQIRAEGTVGASDSIWFVIRYDPYNGARVHDIGGEEYTGGPETVEETGNVNVMAPNSDYSDRGYVYPYQWEELPDRVQSLQSEINGEIDTFVTNTWDDWQAGQINATDLLSNVNLMNNYQVNALGNDTEFNDAVAALAASGFSTTDLRNTSYMNLTYKPNHLTNRSITRQGMLLSGSAPPNETWTVGTEYHSDTIDGAQAVATVDGEIHTINGTFQINAVYDSNGNELDDTEIVSPERTYRSTNTTQIQQQIEELSQLYEDLEERKTSNSGSGGGWSVPNPFEALAGAGVAIKQWLMIVAAILLALAFLAVVS